METYQLDVGEEAAVKALAADVAQVCGSVEDQEFLMHAATSAHKLPDGLREFLCRFKLTESSAVCSISGYGVDDDGIGPTPSHWVDQQADPRTLGIEIYFFLCASLLGDPIAWSTQQDGRIMHDVLPIKGHELEQLGSGSKELLTWHTEEAFHPLRADYVGLMCLRNPDKVETTYASIDDVLRAEGLAGEVIEALRRPVFTIRPDRSHLPVNRGSAKLTGKRAELTEKCYEWIIRMDQDPERVAVFYGAEDTPYLRLDPYFMDGSTDDQRAADALARLSEQIEGSLRGHALAPGEILFLDNFRAVHGRQPFEARFDGTDRWLKRLNMTRDLRKSRARRVTADSRVIY